MSTATPSPGTSINRTTRRRTAVAVCLLLAVTFLVPGLSGAFAQEGTGRLSLFKRIENLDTGASEGRRELWTMHAENVATGEVIEGDGLNGVQSLEVPAGTYKISESGGVPGYRFEAWNCGGADIADPTPEVTVTAGGNLTCTVENVAIKPGLTLVKEVDGGTASPEDWTLRAQGPESISGASGSDAVTNRPLRIGQYTLSEEGGPDGYRNDGWTCDGADLTGDVVTLELGQAATCTVRNVGSPTSLLPTLTLVKEVAGGPAAASDWTLTADGLRSLSGTTGSDDVTAVAVLPGTYTLGEDGPDGYTGAWSCRGSAAGDGTDGTVRVAVGEDVVCTATNTWQGGQLTLVKQIAGTTTAQAADWELTAAGDGATVSGSTGSDAVTAAAVPAGDYTLSESGWTGFDAGAWQCVGGALTGSTVTVATGADVTCTITNTVVPPHLTLVKVVDGGPAAPADWTLSATGPQEDGSPGTITGPSGGVEVSHVTVGEGDHVLAEAAGPDGYEPGEWVCDGASGQSGATVTVGPGDDAVCTVTNTYTGAALTLVKEVEGGSADPADWTLTATDDAGETVAEGASGSDAVTEAHLPVGAYDLAESDGWSGYVSAGWACDGGTLDGSTVTLAPGDDVTCTVTNTAQLPHLTLVKELDDQGYTGDAEPTDWTLTAQGPETSLSGVTGSPEVSHATVEPGSFDLGETGGEDGWTALAWACDGARVTGSTVVVEPGDDVVCTVTNHWLAGELTLHKQVVDDVVPADDWELTAIGPTPLSGHDGSPDVTDVPVAAGDYDLAESGSEWDYEQVEVDCVGGEMLDEDTVRVEDDDDVECTIVNLVLNPPSPSPSPSPSDPSPSPSVTDPTPSPSGSTPGPTDSGSATPTPGGSGGPGGGGDDGSGSDGSGSPGSMAATGANVLFALVAAVIAVGAGLALLWFRRRHG